MKTENRAERCLLLPEAKELFFIALRHLQEVPTSKFVKADLKQQVYSNLAMFLSGSCLAGYKLTDSHAQIVDEVEVRNCLDKINRIVTQENLPLSVYRDTQRHLVQSDLFYLASKSEGVKKTYLLKQALKFAKQAKNLAEVGNFTEMDRYAQYRVALMQEETGIAC